jgi:hypothetical protein
LDLLNTYKSQLQVTIALSLNQAPGFSLQHTLIFLSVLCLHQSLTGNGSQQCPHLLTSLLTFNHFISNETEDNSQLMTDCLFSGETVQFCQSVSRLNYFWPSPAQIFLSLVSSELELLYDWQFTANQFVLAPSPLRLTTRDSFFPHSPTESLQS